MKKIFMGFATGAEHLMYYQATIVYEFFKINGYKLLKVPNEADFIILAGFPQNRYEEIKTLLTIGYYRKKYKAKIIVIGHLSDMISSFIEFENFYLIGLYEFYKFDNFFKHNISINLINITTNRFFIPLNIEELYLKDFGYDIELKATYIFKNNDLDINFKTILSGTYNIDGILEYDSKYNYLLDKTDNIYIETCFGCAFKCSFCKIGDVGFVKSLDKEKIIDKIKLGLKEGKKNVYIMDQDSGSYGKDLKENIDFSDLLNEINNIKGDFKIKLYYFEPNSLLKLYDKIDKKIFIDRLDYLNIPLQTTSQRILKLMNRKYDITKVLDIVKELRLLNSRLTITTILMYGFPTESIDEFKDYFNMIKYFDNIEFLLYSRRPGTKSYNYKNNSYELLKIKYMFLLKAYEKFPKKIDNVDLVYGKKGELLNKIYNYEKNRK